MFEVKKQSRHAYEDLIRELASIEQQLLPENSALAMNLMVLETKIRERFKLMEGRFWDVLDTELEQAALENDFTVADIHAMIPQDLTLPDSLEEIQKIRQQKRNLKTVGMAALLAVLTALGVFGMASVLQIALGWIA